MMILPKDVVHDDPFLFIVFIMLFTLCLCYLYGGNDA
jgi:hypothetical protein